MLAHTRSRQLCSTRSATSIMALRASGSEPTIRVTGQP